jgi:hypothetical protein
VRLASNAPSAPVENGPPTIELEFLGPKPGRDGTMEVQMASAVSGEKLLRNIMSDNKIELYGAYVSKLIFVFVFRYGFTMFWRWIGAGF